ncbi:hypothetical protein B7463_g8594, partial [Scytalidium lignicola]
MLITFVGVDQACIDQEDPDEKRVQIGLMNQIYSNAEKVLIYLCEDNKETDGALDIMGQDPTITECLDNSLYRHDLQALFATKLLFGAYHWGLVADYSLAVEQVDTGITAFLAVDRKCLGEVPKRASRRNLNDNKVKLALMGPRFSSSGVTTTVPRTWTDLSYQTATPRAQSPQTDWVSRRL